MSWKIYGEVLEETNLSNTVIRCPIKFPNNALIKAIGTQLVLYGTPTFSGLTMKVYNNDNQTDEPSTLKETSISSFATDDLLESNAYGIKELYFEFTPFHVRSGDTYHLVLAADSYTKTDNSFLAWRNIWPDPVYTVNINVNSIQVINSPIYISGVIGSEQ